MSGAGWPTTSSTTSRRAPVRRPMCSSSSNREPKRNPSCALYIQIGARMTRGERGSQRGADVPTDRLNLSTIELLSAWASSTRIAFPTRLDFETRCSTRLSVANTHTRADKYLHVHITCELRVVRDARSSVPRGRVGQHAPRRDGRADQSGVRCGRCGLHPEVRAVHCGNGLCGSEYVNLRHGLAREVSRAVRPADR